MHRRRQTRFCCMSRPRTACDTQRSMPVRWCGDGPCHPPVTRQRQRQGCVRAPVWVWVWVWVVRAVLPPRTHTAREKAPPAPERAVRRWQWPVQLGGELRSEPCQSSPVLVPPNCVAAGCPGLTFEVNVGKLGGLHHTMQAGAVPRQARQRQRQRQRNQKQGHPPASAEPPLGGSAPARPPACVHNCVACLLSRQAGRHHACTYHGRVPGVRCPPHDGCGQGAPCHWAPAAACGDAGPQLVAVRAAGSGCPEQALRLEHGPRPPHTHRRAHGSTLRLCSWWAGAVAPSLELPIHTARACRQCSCCSA